jgi:hypothetical protein
MFSEMLSPNVGRKERRKMKANDSYLCEEGQRELAAGVLKQAAQDLRRFHNATSKVERELYFDAHSWVMSDDVSWPFSFTNVCQLLHRAPEDLRQELVGDLAFGYFGQLVRRGTRAVRRLRDSLAERFAPIFDPSPTLPATLAQTWH